MGKILLPSPVKLFIGILATNTSFFRIAEEKLVSLFGVIDLKTPAQGIPFTFTDYYTNEMGNNLKRFFLSFEKAIQPDAITDIKIKTNRLEEVIAGTASAKVTRPVNLDPGYLTSGKVILATTKDYSHRIYLKDGIYAEITLQYRAVKGSGKKFQAMPWTYPDYCTKEYLDFFHQMRKIYLTQNSQ
ncbi:MAG: DUF4416 family protein [Planctomycetes bacterium]|nr:DUF4416 family protein [Planctomycetota bacterium]